ncbi:hypothetical protein HRbin36_02347 [bacterium HR36]|nr:hypothetical protein HRbin36_02347 [bacterium HR36]
MKAADRPTHDANEDEREYVPLKGRPTCEENLVDWRMS